VTRTLRRVPGLTAEQQIETMTKSMVNKIAHGPISELRQNAGQRGDRRDPAGFSYRMKRGGYFAGMGNGAGRGSSVDLNASL
jgi:hypothetical protein